MNVIGHGRLGALIAAASLAGGLARPISEEYRYDDDHEPYPRQPLHSDIRNRPEGMPFCPNNGTEYYESKRPLTKRQKRRLRGKGK